MTAVGHCSSTVTLVNLHRLGNKYVTQRYNLPALRQAAVAVTKITTGKAPPDNEEVYGPRALEVRRRLLTRAGGGYSPNHRFARDAGGDNTVIGVTMVLTRHGGWYFLPVVIRPCSARV